MFNYKILLKFFFLLYLCIPICLFSTINAGSQLWFSGFNPAISGQGYAGVASKGSGFYSLVNPANITTISNFQIFSAGSISSPNWSGTLGFSSPIAPGGNLYLASQYLSFDNTSLTRIGYGKKVRSDLAFGMEGIFTINNSSHFQLGGGFSFGVLWLPKDFKPIHNGWGFVDFSLGSKLKTVFYPIGGINFNPSPEFIFQTGIEATFMDFGFAKWRLVLDYAIGFVPLEKRGDVHLQTWASIGTTWTFWNIWEISTGAILGNHGLGFGSHQVLPYTFGTALGYQWENFSLKARYTFGGHHFFNKVEYLHNIGLEIGFGEKPPSQHFVRLTMHNPGTNYFSPNNDLIQDTIIFYPYIIGISNINAWRIIIQDETGKIVKIFEDHNNRVDDKYTIGTFFKAYFLPNNNNSLPQKIIWDGTDQQSNRLPEGQYIAILQVRYNENMLKYSTQNIIILDISPPTAEITSLTNYLYLGENPSNQLEFIQKLSSDPWSAQLIDDMDQRKIATWAWTADAAPLTNIWKLKDPKRMTIASGIYSYYISSYDKAGNFYATNINNIQIETTKRDSFIKSDHKVFSPNNDLILDNINISINYNTIRGLVRSELSIYTESGDKAYTQELSPQSLTTNIIWNGVDNEGKPVIDNNYIIVLENYYHDQQQFNSNPLIIEVDTTAPIFSTKFSPKRFSPDNDGNNDILKIEIFSEDLNGVKNWILSIKDENQHILKTFTNTKANGIILWDINKKNLVHSSEALTFEIQITDHVGNTLAMPIHQMRVDILTDPNDKNLISSPNSAYFEEGVGVLHGDIFTYLDHIWDYIQYYPHDKIEILSQASYHEAQNSRYEAYRLSILRGDAIKAYLVNKGFAATNISMNIEIFDEKNLIKQKELRKVKLYIKKMEN